MSILQSNLLSMITKFEQMANQSLLDAQARDDADCAKNAEKCISECKAHREAILAITVKD